jgi:hypothetical protein
LAQPGLIPQISGKLKNQRVNELTIFADHYSDHIYAYLMQDLTLDETLLAKHGYEHFLAMHGIISKEYHADNGCFADKGFCDYCLIKRSSHFALWCWKPSSEWHCRAQDQRLDTWGADSIASCKTYVARIYHYYSLTLCSQML